ncbi:MAG TPA: tryptophan--tRNA ligase, partial [Terriglobales bacterium]|nr:tryptophan--tRNA ligase [Terriglobales bacterium]
SRVSAMPIALTGIKPSGHPHIGNYLGMIRPALALAERHQALYFIADYHALTTLHVGDELRLHTREVAATWLALGLDPERSLLYRQSDVPEVMELAWILACFTAKGLLDRAHAYKDALALQKEVTAGVYTYPVLMAADILAFGANLVPVGRDQKQHLEMCRDIAQRFNHTYGDLLVVPDALIQEEVETIPGLDGRKMSKSYENTIPLFLATAPLRKLIMRIQTDSTPVAEPKVPESAAVFQLYRHIVGARESEALAEKLRAGGTGWAAAKEALLAALESRLGPARSRYDQLMLDFGALDRVLAAGAEKARALAIPRMEKIRRAVGVR